MWKAISNSLDIDFIHAYNPRPVGVRISSFYFSLDQCAVDPEQHFNQQQADVTVTTP